MSSGDIPLISIIQTASNGPSAGSTQNPFSTPFSCCSRQRRPRRWLIPCALDPIPPLTVSPNPPEVDELKQNVRFSSLGLPASMWSRSWSLMSPLSLGLPGKGRRSRRDGPCGRARVVGENAADGGSGALALGADRGARRGGRAGRSARLRASRTRLWQCARRRERGGGRRRRVGCHPGGRRCCPSVPSAGAASFAKEEREEAAAAECQLGMSPTSLPTADGEDFRLLARACVKTGEKTSFAWSQRWSLWMRFG